MTIEVLNKVGRHEPSEETVRHIAKCALEALGLAEAELSIALVDDDEIQKLNAKWRGKDAPTNVLSFPQEGDVLGDVVLSLETVERQGEETGSGYEYTFAFYLVHGILHLVGWDHETGADENKMMARTREILEAAGFSS